MQAVDTGHAIDRLRQIAAVEPGEDPETLKEVQSILSRMGSGASGYLSEKIAATKGSFETWLSAGKWEKYGSDPKVFRTILMLDIAKLGKALARGAQGQD
jgi:hypothetical protein